MFENIPLSRLHVFRIKTVTFFNGGHSDHEELVEATSVEKALELVQEGNVVTSIEYLGRIIVREKL